MKGDIDNSGIRQEKHAGYGGSGGYREGWIAVLLKEDSLGLGVDRKGNEGSPRWPGDPDRADGSP